MAAEIVFAASERTRCVSEIDMDIAHVECLERWSRLGRLSHLIIQVLNVVIVLDSFRFRGQNAINNRVKIKSGDYWILAPSEMLIADTFLGEQVVLHHSEHRFSELLHKQRAFLESVTHGTSCFAHDRSEFQDSIMDRICLQDARGFASSNRTGLALSEITEHTIDVERGVAEVIVPEVSLGLVMVLLLPIFMVRVVTPMMVTVSGLHS